MRCPCRKRSEIVDYAHCCEPFHASAALPPTAEALMRSRYSAFALRNADYLLATWHPSTRPATLALEPGTEWVQLRVLSARQETETATVSFIARARSRPGGPVDELREASRFVREAGRWLYVDAATPPGA